jgi:hypothetical protein
MRFTLAAALAALFLPALAQAQQGRPQGSQRPAPAPAQPQAAAPSFFLCRTAEEVCTLGIVTGNNQIAVIFTNAQGAEAVEKPIDVLTGDAPGSPLDLTANLGRVVLLTGAYDPKLGLIRSALVDAASPVVSTWIKAQLAGGSADESGAKSGGKPAAQRKR